MKARSNESVIREAGTALRLLALSHSIAAEVALFTCFALLCAIR